MPTFVESYPAFAGFSSTGGIKHWGLGGYASILPRIKFGVTGQVFSPQSPTISYRQSDTANFSPACLYMSIAIQEAGRVIIITNSGQFDHAKSWQSTLSRGRQARFDWLNASHCIAFTLVNSLNSLLRKYFNRLNISPQIRFLSD